MGDTETLRERRRARILQNSENRMQKLLGYNRHDSEISNKYSPKVGAFENEGDFEDFRAIEHFRDVPVKAQTKDNAELFSADKLLSKLTECDSKTTAENIPALEEDGVKQKENLKLRFFVMFVAGIMIRLMLETSLKVLVFKENVIYQFILLQVIFAVSNQRLKQGQDCGMEYTVMSYALRFLGMTKRLIDGVLSLYSLWRTVANDFCVFMFTFLLTHYVCS